VLINAEGAHGVLNKGIPVDLGLVKRGFDSMSSPGKLTSTYLLCFTVNSVYKGVISGKIAGYSANKVVWTGIGLPQKVPTKNPIKNTVANSVPAIGP
jgi:hypothetical protein